MKDEKIIELYFARSETAINETDKKYGACCRSMTLNILGSREDSEECVNDTYLKVWDTIPPERPVKLGAFVIRIARNLAFDLRKAKSRLIRGGGFEAVSFDEIAECLPAAGDTESKADSRAALAAVEKFIFSLSREKQTVFMRRYFYMQSCTDIAADLGIPEGKVKMTLKRTRDKLREYLEKEGIDV
ncbi:MAG: RNA polymerase sigma factor [Ruminiclostridium sp.]|nr:RNA polymerase sigma factor [Ruminiclostridium sp.]